MAVTYPITLPSTPAPRAVSMKAVSFSSMTRSPWSGAQQVQLNNGMVWAARLDYPPMSEVQARAWIGCLMQLNGRYGTLLFGSPNWQTPQGTWAGAPVVDGAGQAGQLLALRDFTAGATGKAGDYFQIGTGADARLYMATADFTADGSGDVTIDIWPRLRGAPIDGAALVTSSPQGVFRLMSPSLEWSFEPFRYGLSLDLEEAL